MKPVCLVIGAGAGIGGHVAQRFAREGYHAVLCRRRDLDGLNRLVTTIVRDGGAATGFLLDATDTLGKMLGPEAFQRLRETRGNEHDGLLLPAHVAETCLHLAQQHRSCWTHELDLRAYSDRAWWNH